MTEDIDVDVARWILEFLVRQPIEDRLLSSLITALPLTDESSSLKKSLILRRIESEISTGSVSEKVLDFLEQIEELDFLCKIKQHSDVMKTAYCSVAVACTVKFLDGNDVDGNKFGYFDAVKRIWRGRVCKMEKVDKVGLVSDELRSWADEIEAAVWDDSMYDNVLKRSEGINAVEAVRLYVKEEKENMGPPFLELVADALRTDDRLNGLLGNIAGMNAPSLPSSDQNLVHTRDVSTEVQRGNMRSRRNYAASKRPRVSLSGTSKGAKITDTDASRAAFSCQNLPSTPEVNEMQEALKSSSLELKGVVKDPLPEALDIAATVLCSIERKDTSKMPVEENHVGVNPSVANSSGAVQASGGDTGNHCYEHQKDAPKPSLMVRNSTARTFEWDDSIDGLSEESPNHGSRAHLPSPKGRVVSPLKQYEMNKLKKRRKIKRWSLSEEETLRIGVETYGRGNWKLILNAYRDIFEERTEVDLKDKWRNMTR